MPFCGGEGRVLKEGGGWEEMHAKVLVCLNLVRYVNDEVL